MKTHRIFSEDIKIPDNPKYRIGEKIEGFEYGTLSSYYGPGNFLDLFGREWILPDNPKFEVGVGSVEFSVEVRNQKMGFRGFLKINAMYTSNQKISLSFPNFLDLDEAACAQSDAWEKSVGLRDPNEPELAHRNQFRQMFMEQ